MIDFEKFLNDRINNNKNLESLASFFTEDELSQLSDKAISIVGTNAKTSTANYIYQVLSELGIKTLLFTSPHLISYDERIQSNQNTINHSQYVEKIKDFEVAANEGRVDLEKILEIYKKISFDFVQSDYSKSKKN